MSHTTKLTTKLKIAFHAFLGLDQPCDKITLCEVKFTFCELNNLLNYACRYVKEKITICGVQCTFCELHDIHIFSPQAPEDEDQPSSRLLALLLLPTPCLLLVSTDQGAHTAPLTITRRDDQDT